MQVTQRHVPVNFKYMIALLTQTYRSYQTLYKSMKFCSTISKVKNLVQDVHLSGSQRAQHYRKVGFGEVAIKIIVKFFVTRFKLTDLRQGDMCPQIS